MKVTRIAPSPTGMFHIGTARTAYFNWLMARNSGGKFIVRIDDTDLERNNEDYVKIIYDSLDWLGLDYDLTFRQSERLTRYREVSDQLLSAGNAFVSDGGVVFDWKGNVPDSWEDKVNGQVKISRQDNELSRQFVLLRADGMPTYNFSTVVDDIDFGITDVIRGSDHIANTTRQILLRTAIGSQEYNFYHIGLIHKDGKKMSKRDPSVTDLAGYKSAGYNPETILAYLVKLGWNVKDPNVDKKYPVITKDIALELFSTGKMRGAPSNFDHPKLDWIQKKLANKDSKSTKE